MRGSVGVGVEGSSKAMNLGSRWRTAHAFGARFAHLRGAAAAEATARAASARPAGRDS